VLAIVIPIVLTEESANYSARAGGTFTAKTRPNNGLSSSHRNGDWIAALLVLRWARTYPQALILIMPLAYAASVTASY
jgi:hypothetical protein